MSQSSSMVPEVEDEEVTGDFGPHFVSSARSVVFPSHIPSPTPPTTTVRQPSTGQLTSGRPTHGLDPTPHHQRDPSQPSTKIALDPLGASWSIIGSEILGAPRIPAFSLSAELEPPRVAVGQRFDSTFAEPFASALALLSEATPSTPSAGGGVRSEQTLAAQALDQNSSVQPPSISAPSSLARGGGL